MPATGTQRNTRTASAELVDMLAVGARTEGNWPAIAHAAMKAKRLPANTVRVGEDLPAVSVTSPSTARHDRRPSAASRPRGRWTVACPRSAATSTRVSVMATEVYIVSVRGKGPSRATTSSPKRWGFKACSREPAAATALRPGSQAPSPAPRSGPWRGWPLSGTPRSRADAAAHARAPPGAGSRSTGAGRAARRPAHRPRARPPPRRSCALPQEPPRRYAPQPHSEQQEQEGELKARLPAHVQQVAEPRAPPGQQRDGPAHPPQQSQGAPELAPAPPPGPARCLVYALLEPAQLTPHLLVLVGLGSRMLHRLEDVVRGIARDRDGGEERGPRAPVAQQSSRGGQEAHAGAPVRHHQARLHHQQARLRPGPQPHLTGFGGDSQRVESGLQHDGVGRADRQVQQALIHGSAPPPARQS